MVQIFECKSNTDLIAKYRESLGIARKRISHHPILNQILRNFDDYGDYSRPNLRNVIFNISLPLPDRSVKYLERIANERQ